MKKIIAFFCLFLIAAMLHLHAGNKSDPESSDKLPNFVLSPFFNEQTLSFTYTPGIKININAPADFDASKPTRLVVYALPNGNTTEWTIGKQTTEGDNWHYDIQHIGAQTRFAREKDTSHNIIVVYLESDCRSWGQWLSVSPDRIYTAEECLDYIYSLFEEYNPSFELTCHSGGGNLILEYVNILDSIPSKINRVSFIDGNYRWNDSKHGKKFARWIESSPENTLAVICYDDANAHYNGKPFISREDGTWYNTEQMQKCLKKLLKKEKWRTTTTDSTICRTAGNGRIYFYSLRNPEHKIYHTVLVERNGFIQSLLSGTSYENSGYSMMEPRAYDRFIQDSVPLPVSFPIPPRKADAPTGSGFARMSEKLNAADRDSIAFNQIVSGNVPDMMRQPIYITQDSVTDAEGQPHKITICVLPDFIAIGDDADFLRIPLLPATAQKIADNFGCILLTRKVSDMIHKHSGLKLKPHPMTPDSTMTTVPVFSKHDSIIEAERKLTGSDIALTSGHKKDIVITNRIADEQDRLFIYGWHYPDGTPIQPLSGAHNSMYVDYSHGVRLINDIVIIDGKAFSAKQILQDPVLYKLLSDEDKPMKVTGYRTYP